VRQKQWQIRALVRLIELEKEVEVVVYLPLQPLLSNSCEEACAWCLEASGIVH
jgi:hypothetical protein